MYWNSSNGQKVKELELLFGDAQIRNYLMGKSWYWLASKVSIYHIHTYVRVEC